MITTSIIPLLVQYLHSMIHSPSVLTLGTLRGAVLLSFLVSSRTIEITIARVTRERRTKRLAIRETHILFLLCLCPLLRLLVVVEVSSTNKMTASGRSVTTTVVGLVIKGSLWRRLRVGALHPHSDPPYTHTGHTYTHVSRSLFICE